jgi:hypothetical protein
MPSLSINISRQIGEMNQRHRMSAVLVTMVNAIAEDFGYRSRRRWPGHQICTNLLVGLLPERNQQLKHQGASCRRQAQ